MFVRVVCVACGVAGGVCARYSDVCACGLHQGVSSCSCQCVVVGIEHGVHGREARVALDAGGVVALAVLARFCQFVSTVVVRQCCVLSGLMALCVRRNAQGGAIYASSSSSINIQHTTFVGNRAVCMLSLIHI